MAIEAFAEVSDLEQRFRPLTLEEKDRAEALLGDASVLISSEMSAAGADIDPEDEVQASALKMVCCSVVKRALSGSSAESITQSSVTTGPFSKQVTYANPTADLYLTRQERNVLGISSSNAGFAFIRPVCAGCDTNV